MDQILGSKPGDLTVMRTWAYTGLITTYTDRNGRITVTTPNPATNRVLEEWKNTPTGTVVHSVETIFDSAGGLVRASEFNGSAVNGTPTSVVSIEIDQFGRNISETSAASMFGLQIPTYRQTTGYDSSGRRNNLLFERLDPDVMGELTARTLTNTAYAYDNIGRLKQLQRSINQTDNTLWAGNTAFAPSHLSVAYDYYLDGQRAQVHRFGEYVPFEPLTPDPEGFTNYLYDDNGRISEISHKQSITGPRLATEKQTIDVTGRLSETQRTLFDSTPPDQFGGQTPIVDEAFKFTFDGQNQIDLVQRKDSSGNWVEERDYHYGANNNQEYVDASLQGKLNRLLSGELSYSKGSYQMKYDNEGNVVDIRHGVLLRNQLTWDHRGRLVENVVINALGGEERRIEFRYDALNRLIGTREYNYDTGADPVAVTSFAYDGQSRIAETDLLNEARITRNYVIGVGGEAIATDEFRAGNAPATVWFFLNAGGSLTTLATKHLNGDWDIYHRRFESFGSYSLSSQDTNYGPVGDVTDLLKSVPAVWNGAIGHNLRGALDNLYLIGGRWYHDELGRFFSEDPAGIAGGLSNLYVLNGNDPFAGLNDTGIDWPKLEGPSPFGAYGAFTFGVADALAFGHFDDVIFANGAQQYAAQNNWYYAGLGVGIAANIAIGSYLGAMGGASLAARGYVVYNVVGDAVGVYDSYSAYRNGTFGVLDAIGLASSTAGLAGFAHGLGRGARSGRIAGNVADAAQASRLASQLNVNPSQLPSNPVVASSVEGVIPRCFTANTEVLVRLPEDYETDDDLIASLPVTVSHPDSEDSGSSFWIVTGAALVAVGVHSLAASVAQKRKTKRQQQELSNLDLAFCDYERMEAAVV